MEAACDNHSSNNPFGNEMKSPSMTITEEYNESCDKKVVNNNPITSELENNNQFDDDLGPETDVDGQDDANSNDSTNKLQTEDILDNNIPNSAKSDPLENKIIQHLSEQNAHFLDINNPFKDETIDEYQEKILLESINDGSDRMSEQVVDNKIIDALESLGFTKEEKVCCQSENVALDLMGDPVDSSNLAEKVDYIHEKQCTGLEAETVEPPNDHSTSIFEMDADVNGAQDDTDFIHLPTAIGDPCTAEESDDEEEEEWNYIKGDKKLLGQSDAATAEKSDNTNETFEQLTNEVEKTTETVIVQSTLPGDDLLLDTCTSMDVEDNLWMDNEFQTKATAIQQVHLEHTEESPTQESSHPCDVEPVIDPKTSTILDCDEQQNTADNQSSPFDCVTTDQLEKELVSVEESSVDAKEEDHQIVDTNTKTGFEGNIERPDNLSLEMASKLNPEAKEFVPVCSPTRSDPASPVTSIPPVLQNPYLILPNDMVIAQSPKKDITTMDNIDVPAEDDFQHEMNNRPHEFENTAGYTNGNLETFQSHSPVSEPSYQEINLKEAMQCDEKLDGEYSDEKQAALTGEIIPEVPIEKSLLTAFSKEPDAMNTSFYEGRDEPMLTSSSDELNKVHLLPDEDVSEQCSVDETKNLCLLENEANLNAQALSNVENEARESETVSTPDVGNGNESSVNIFAVASQVVSDVTALVDQMQIDSQSPTSEIPTILDSLTENPDNLTEKNEIVNDSVTLLNLNDQSEQKNINVLDIDNVDKSDHSETIEENIVLPTVETKEMATPEVLVMEEKVNIENENIQTSVLHVETPIVEDNESPATLRSLPNEGSEQFVQDNRETEIVKTPFDETVDLKSADVSVVLSDNKISSAVVLDTPKTEEASNQNAGAEETLIESDVPVKTIAASSMSKTVTAKSTSKVSAAPSIEKKTTPISSKLNTKSTKLTTATKPTTTTSTVRKSAVSSVATSATSVKPSATASKPSTASAATRTNVASKTISEKKPLLGLTKKPSASLTTNSDEPKPTVTARKVPTTTTSKPVPTKSTTSSSVNNRPSSTVPKTAVPPKAVASTTRPTSSPPAKTRTVASSVASVKPRVLPIKTTVKAVSSLSTTTTTATTTASRTSVPGSTTRKLNNVQGTGQKTTATSKPSTLESKTNCTTSRVSATAKTNTTTVGSQRKLSAPQNKKLIPSPALKTTGSKSSTATKPAPISKKAVNNCSEMNASENDAKSLLDYDKQLKNDCNQLITKNGIETQMIVIDSAAD